VIQGASDVRSSAFRQVRTAAVAACVLRLAFVLLYPQFGSCPDCEVYDRLALNLASGRGLVGGTSDDPVFAEIENGATAPEVGFGPVYPAFLATIYSTVGHRIGAVRIAQALLGAVTVPLAWRIAAVAFGNPVGIVCAWLVALSPPLVMYTGLVLTENLTVVWLLFCTWLFMRALQRGTTLSYLLSGGTLGVLILLREEMILLLPAFAALAWWNGRPHPAWSSIAAFVLATCVSVGAWTVRNYMVFHQPILASAHGGEQLWLSAKGWSEWHFDDPGLRQLATGRSYVERNAAMQREGWRLIMSSPGQYLIFCFERVPMLWLSSHTTYIRGLTESFGAYYERGAFLRLVIKAALFGVQLALQLLALLGAFAAARAARASVAVWLLAAPIVTITVVHFFLFATPRYQVPVLPFVLAFSALAATQAWDRLGVKRLTRGHAG
jgi:4-amino-4-deoxy-L-arabinose transferase-like glycosyltransferase